MEIIVDEAKKYNLPVDVTNGPGWPISSPTLTSADDPGTSYEMTYGTAEVVAGDTYQAIVPATKHDKKLKGQQNYLQ